MQWQEISVKTQPPAIEAVADAFYGLGAAGVVIEDPEALLKMSQSGLWDAFEFPEHALTPSAPLVKGYLPSDEELPVKLEQLKNELAEIALRSGHAPYEFSLVALDEEDWANSWKSYFKPLKIGEKIVIRPTWEPYEPQEGEIVLDLDPGMAFGTGSHITTILCIRLLEKYLKKGMQVVDVGTGTGILAMCAASLGAGQVQAYDYDAVAVKTARENIAKNGLDQVVSVARHDLLVGLSLQGDLIVANIIADIIRTLLPQAHRCLKPGGIFVASGIISERKDEILKAAGQLELKLLEEAEEEGWVALVWQAKES